MIPLSEPVIGGNAWKYVKECLDSGWVSSVGRFVDKFEAKVCAYTGAKYAVACINGTSGLQVALKLAGVGVGNEVIVPDLTFIAPVNAVRYSLAEPVFMDCDVYLNIDPVKLMEFCENECIQTKLGLKNKRTKRIIKAVVPVHVFGNPCDLTGVMRVAKKFNLKVVEDATESIGAYYITGGYKGKYAGTIGDFGVYSFNGNKIITTGGGGMIVTDSAVFAAKARYLTTQAKDDSVKSIHHEIGYNFRLTNLQAALGLAQLEQLKKFIKIKKDNYKLYKKFLNGIAGIKILDIPEGTAPNYWFYSLFIEEKEFGVSRDRVMESLRVKGIQTRPVWYLNHLQRPYRKNQSYKIENALWFGKRVLNLPCSVDLVEKQIKYITLLIRNLKRR